MNGINLIKVFQRAAGRCEAVYGVKCLTREQKTLSGYVIFLMERRKSKQHINKSGTAQATPSSLSLRWRLIFLSDMNRTYGKEFTI